MVEKYINVNFKRSKILYKYPIIHSIDLRRERKRKEFQERLAIQKELDNVY